MPIRLSYAQLQDRRHHGSRHSKESLQSIWLLEHADSQQIFEFVQPHWQPSFAQKEASFARQDQSQDPSSNLADLKTAFEMMGGYVETKLVYFKLYGPPQFKSQLEQFNKKMSVADVEKIFRKKPKI